MRSEYKGMKVFLSAASHCLSSAGVALHGPADAHQEAETPERGRAGAEEAEEGGGGGQEGQTPGGGQEEAAGAETQKEVSSFFFLFFFFFLKSADADLSAVSGRRMEWWQASGYRSRCLPPIHSEGEDEEEEEEDDDSVSSTDSASTDINYVLGDVTHPHMATSDAIIVHCVGRRRIFIQSEEELGHFLFNL